MRNWRSRWKRRIRLAALGRADDAKTDAAQLPPPGIARVRAYFAEAAGTAARYLARPDGPRVGALGFVGWDTHINEGAAAGQLANLLGALDGALAAIETNMGDSWRETVVAVITEFGRTARINGTDGTDHGTGTVALLAGGALKGGRVIADWPGLKPANLYEDRDLKPTTDLRSVLKGLLKDHLRVDDCRAREHGVSGQRRREADGRPRRLRSVTLRHAGSRRAARLRQKAVAVRFQCWLSLKSAASCAVVVGTRNGNAPARMDQRICDAWRAFARGRPRAAPRRHAGRRPPVPRARIGPGGVLPRRGQRIAVPS